MSRSNNYEEIGYYVLSKGNSFEEESRPVAKSSSSKIFIDQIPKRPYRDPPDWVRLRLNYLKETMRKYK